MANAITINGAVQPRGFGLGNLTPFAPGQIPSQWAGAVRNVGSYKRSQHEATSMLCQHESVARMLPALTCGMPGTLACNYGAAQSGFSGLGSFGDVSNWACSDWAAIMTQMQVLLSQAEQQGIDSVQYHAARDYFDNNTGPFQKPVFTCASATETAKMFYSDLSRVMGAGPGLPDILNKNTSSGDTVSTVIKWGTVALVALAGAYTIGPIFRGIGSLIGKGRR